MAKHAKFMKRKNNVVVLTLVLCICLAIKVFKYNQFHKYSHIYQLLSLHILMQTITYFCILILGGKMPFLYVCINVVIIIYLICLNCLWVVTQRRIAFLQHLKINVKSLIFFGLMHN